MAAPTVEHYDFYCLRLQQLVTFIEKLQFSITIIAGARQQFTDGRNIQKGVDEYC